MVKRRHVIAGLVALPLIGVGRPLAQSGDTMLKGDIIPTSEGDLVVHPVNHASLLLGWRDQIIYSDPVGGAARYAGLLAPTVIIITHAHSDHFDPPTLTALTADRVPLIVNRDVYDKLPATLRVNAKAMANGDHYTLNEVPISAVPAHNTTPERTKYHPRGIGNGYVLKFGNTAVYIAGDTEPTPAMLALHDIDVAFLPMNLPYTMTVEQAAEAINVFKPKIVYPYHYGESDLSVLAPLVNGDTEVRLRNWYPAEG